MSRAALAQYEVPNSDNDQSAAEHVQSRGENKAPKRRKVPNIGSMMSQAGTYL